MPSGLAPGRIDALAHTEALAPQTVAISPWTWRGKDSSASPMRQILTSYRYSVYIPPMSVPMALLALLSPAPNHGFALKRRYDTVLGKDRPLAFGQVYSTLARLERDGLTTDIGIEHGSAADRHLYAITPAGITEFEAWLTAPVAAGSRPTELFTKVILALESGRDPHVILAQQRSEYLIRMRDLHRLRGTDAIDLLAADYEIAHLEADLNWIEQAGARLGARK